MRICCRVQEAFEKCWAHSPLRAAAHPFTRCRYCRTRASMSTTMTTTTARDRGDRSGPIEWAQLVRIETIRAALLRRNLVSSV